MSFGKTIFQGNVISLDVDTLNDQIIPSIGESYIIPNLNDDETYEIDGKQILKVQRKITDTLTMDFTNSETIEDKSGGIAKLASRNDLIPSSNWLMSVLGNTIPDESGDKPGTSYNSYASGSNYQFGKGTLSQASILFDINNLQNSYLDMWIYIDEPGVIIQQYEKISDGFIIEIINNFKLRFTFQNGVNKYVATSDTKIPIGEEIHLAILFSTSTNFEIYVNSTQLAMTVSEDTLTSGAYNKDLATTLMVGNFNGKIRDIFYIESTDYLDLTLHIRYNKIIDNSMQITDPISYWRLDGSGTVMLDSVGTNNFDDPVVPGFRSSSGLLNNCLENPIGTLTVGDSFGDFATFSEDTTFTYEFWIKTLTRNSNKIIGILDAFVIGLVSGHVKVSLGDTEVSIIGNTFVADNNTWHHVVITNDGSGLIEGFKIYVNTVLQTLTRSDTTFNTILSSDPLTIGFTGYKWNFLDEIAIYDYALTLDQIIFKYNLGVGTNVTVFDFVPTHRWRLAENVISEIAGEFTINTISEPITYSENAIKLANNISLIYNFTTNSPLHIDFWIKPYSHTGIIFAKGEYYKMIIDKNRRLSILINYTYNEKYNIIWTKQLNLNTWHHVTWSSLNFKLYVDKVEQSVYVVDGTSQGFNFPTGNIKIGYIDGLIKNFTIHNESFILYDYVIERFNNTLPVIYHEPILSFNFEDESFLTTIIEEGGNDMTRVQNPYDVYSAEGKIGNSYQHKRLTDGNLQTYYELTDGSIFATWTQAQAFTFEFWFAYSERYGLNSPDDPLRTNDSVSEIFAFSTDGTQQFMITLVEIHEGATQIQVRLGGVAVDFVERNYIIPTSFLTNEWHHVVFIYDGSGHSNGISLYLDTVSLSDIEAGPDIEGDIVWASGAGSTYDYFLYCASTEHIDKRFDLFRLYDTNVSEYYVKFRYNSGASTLDLGPRILANYTFDGDTNDSSVNGNDLLFIGNDNMFEDGYFNMTSITGNINIDNNYNLDSSLTIETKIQTTSFGWIFRKMDYTTLTGYELYMTRDGKLRFTIAQGDSNIYEIVTDTVDLNDDTLRKILLAWNGSVAVIYDDIYTGAHPITTTSNTFGTGDATNTKSLIFSNGIDIIQDDIYIFPNALDATNAGYRFADGFDSYYPINSLRTVKIQPPLRYFTENLTAIAPSTTTPANTSILYAFQNKVGKYFRWTGTVWEEITDLSTANTLAQLASIDFSTIRSTLEKVVVILDTTDRTVTPEIATIEYTYETYRKLKNTEIEIYDIDDFGYWSVVKNISGGTLSDLKLYTIRYDDQ